MHAFHSKQQGKVAEVAGFGFETSPVLQLEAAVLVLHIEASAGVDTSQAHQARIAPGDARVHVIRPGAVGPIKSSTDMLQVAGVSGAGVESAPALLYPKGGERFGK